MRTKALGIIVIVIIVIIAGYFLLRGNQQTPTPAPASQVQIKEGGLEEVRAKFKDTDLADWKDYQKDPFCIDASVIGKPELGGMGFHATKSELLEDEIIDPLNPETLLVDGEDNIVGVEYMVQSETQPSLFGIQFEATPPEGHHGFEAPHWDLHLWLIDNSASQFAAFNPDLICPEGSLPPAPEETAEAIREIQVVGTDFAFSPSAITVKAGQKVKLIFQNSGGAPHNLTIEGLGVGTKTISNGKTDTIEFIAPSSGTYAFFCSIPGHRSSGMEGSLTAE